MFNQDKNKDMSDIYEMLKYKKYDRQEKILS